MKYKLIGRFVLIITLLMCVISIAGTFATWIYAEQFPDLSFVDYFVKLEGFYWEGVEELPDDIEIGGSHVYLIQRLVESDVGLNAPSSHLNEVIASRLDSGLDNASSVAPTKGGNLKPIFNTSETSLLDFMIYIYADENGNPYAYDLYTFESQDRAYVGSLVSPTYKTTVILKDGKFKAERTYVGSAQAIKYEAAQGSGKALTIDPASWVASQ